MKLFVRMLREKGVDLETVHGEMEDQTSAFRVEAFDEFEEIEHTMMLPETPIAPPRRRTGTPPEGRQSLMQNRLQTDLVDSGGGILDSRTRSGRFIR